MTTLPGGTLTLADDLTVTRFGYGAMQLAGPGVMGPPEDRQGAEEVLRAVIELGITHIDTSDYYGPFTVNELIRETLHPYPEGLHIVTKVGARRTADGDWPSALGREDLREAIDENLEHLGVEAMDVVNLRVGGAFGAEEGSIAEPYEALVELQQEGRIRHLGISNVTMAQFEEARSIAPFVTVQNHYNLAHRDDDALVDRCAELGIGFTPFFPLGGFNPLQSDTLGRVAARLGASPLQIALAWLLQRSPVMLLIPGTKSVQHLHENVEGAGIELPADALEELDAIGR
ncbi:oxidoreductase [Curtobacterium sp. MCBD17_034]|uniref:oxidoreductase n=1 Tax=unclassified Curtobacterium TaxID=257496 RepID=UPI000DA99011|nr:MULTISPECIES: oxidoreductase [unclassified Curtobacterium]PZF60128.1 oxidoreductase [Curtobacterium sp. MCBD17_034]PZM34813.1 oxidoreductase [Curtobacterium sp. MCBD17_031]